MDELNALAAWMAGEYETSNTPNGERGVTSRLLMIPFGGEGGEQYWLYIEQAASNNLSVPYRQRVYQLRKIGQNLFEAVVYALIHAEAFAIGERVKSRNHILKKLGAGELVERPGCSIIMRKMSGESFAGGTLGEGCPTEIGEALYATSQIVVSEKEIISWDKGFDRSGKQVWGATMGGVVFKKIRSFPL